MLRNFFAREELAGQMEGQTLVEYALIIALVSVALVAALGVMTGSIETAFGFISDTLDAAR